ncbi:MAG: hypothetical protein M0Q98_14450 [Pseudomonas sp.]|jgi:hypothetical protein|nr:hypothetical protein [Pseudomonas sp.]MDY0413325.1 hypothetical protein [Pseudomonas sp.]NLO54638.1 hypothetical protein [Gammaproteobacteria bacterium]
MTVRFFLPSLLVFLFGCTDESQHNVSATVVDAVAHGNNITADASSTSAVNLKDIFLLLPDDVFPLEAISTAKRKQLLKHIGEDSAFDISPTPIDIYDVKNGYLNLTGMQFGWEMSYWNLQDGRKLVAINNGTESGSEIRVFFYQKGMLTEDPNYQLGGQQNYNLSDFIDIAQLSPENRKFALQQFTKGAYHLYYQLPQKGTSLKVSLDADRLLGYAEVDGIPDEAIKYVTLKWNNEKWER